MTEVDPDVVQALCRLLSRRSVLRGAGTAGLLAATVPALAACQTATDQAAATGAAAANDRSDTELVVNFSNWPLYIDVDPKNPTKRPTMDQFTALSGIKVNYVEDINDNAQFYRTIRAGLAAGKDIKRDLLVLSDWMAARLIRLKWVQRLDVGNLPNLANIQPTLLESPFDPDRAREPYSVPWAGVMTGIAYNRTVTTPVTSIGELFTRSDLKGRVTVLTEMSDTVGLTLLDAGVDPGDLTDAQFAQGLAIVAGAVRSGQIRRFTGNEYTKDLASGRIAACLAWSGDIVQLQADHPQIEFVIPDGGGLLANDDMLVPNRARHKKNAEKLINYYYDPTIAARLAASVNYLCPVVGAREILAKTDPKTAANPLIFPTDAQLAKLYRFKALEDKTQQDYDNQFKKISNA